MKNNSQNPERHSCGSKLYHSAALASSYPRPRKVKAKKGNGSPFRAMWAMRVTQADGIGKGAGLAMGLKCSEKQDLILEAEWDQLARSDWELGGSAWNIAQGDTIQQ